MSAIFYHNAQQQKMAEESMAKAQQSFKKNITTLILPAKEFYNAEK